MKISQVKKVKKGLLFLIVFALLIVLQEAFLNFFFPTFFLYLAIVFFLSISFERKYKNLSLIMGGILLDLFSFYPFGVFTFCICLSFLLVDFVGYFLQKRSIIANSFLLALFLLVFHFLFSPLRFSLNWFYGVF